MERLAALALPLEVVDTAEAVAGASVRGRVRANAAQLLANGQRGMAALVDRERYLLAMGEFWRTKVADNGGGRTSRRSPSSLTQGRKAKQQSKSRPSHGPAPNSSPTLCGGCPFTRICRRPTQALSLNS